MSFATLAMNQSVNGPIRSHAAAVGPSSPKNASLPGDISGKPQTHGQEMRSSGAELLSSFNDQSPTDQPASRQKRRNYNNNNWERSLVLLVRSAD